VSVDEHTIELGPAPVFYRSASAVGPMPLYLHGIPTSSDDWVPFLERTGGIAPDLIGFGRTGKAGNLDYSIAGIATFVEALLDELEIESVKLVAHDWGAAIGLELARRRPARFERLVLLNPLPLLEGFRWPRVARLWRRPAVGEVVMGSTNRWLLARTLRQGSVTPQAWPEERIKAVWEQFDQGTQRAILRLHRSVNGRRLTSPGPLTAPALVIWGEEDPWFSVAHADAFRALLPQAKLEKISGAGHWPWLDRPELVERVAGYLAEGE
jgi:pimeloyl-ACP methyl ester carboxylesterase